MVEGRAIADLRPQLIIFGDSFEAEIIDTFPYLKSEEGIEEIEYVLRPSVSLVRRYDVKDDERDDDGNIRYRIPISEIVILSDSPNYGAVFCFRDFKKNLTNVHKIIGIMIDKNQELERKCDRLVLQHEGDEEKMRQQAEEELFNEKTIERLMNAFRKVLLELEVARRKTP